MYDPEQGKSTAGDSGPATAQSPGPVSADAGQAAAAQLDALNRAVGSGASWFYWIAGLSIVNTVIAMFNGSISFFFGLGVTQMMDAAVIELGKWAAIFVLPFNAVVAGFYVMLGYFAARGARWAFITGLIVYTLDALLVAVFQQWLLLVFHAWAFYGIYRGMKANNAARGLKASMSG